jgi:hypothetical protein
MGNKSANRFHLPLHDGDSPTQTVGCRHTNPTICAKNAMETVCAFARRDDRCMAPPVSWAKQFKKLQAV